MKAPLLGMVLTLIAPMIAAELAPPPMTGLLPTELARPLLDQDPGVAAAQADLQVALHEAGILERSPHEWSLRTTGQQRNLDRGPTHDEWHLALERTLRLPGKAAADRGLGAATVEAAQARRGELLHETARELMTLWLEWLAAEQTRELAADALLAVERAQAAVHKRVTAGDAAQLDLSLAQAELATQQVFSNDAQTQAAASWARLSTRFPATPRQPLPMAEPIPVEGTVALWQRRILEQSDALKLTEAALQGDEPRAARARSERLPDPTLGAFTASEASGHERIAGVSLSLPIPGGSRALRDAQAYAMVEVSRQRVELKRRQLESEIASAVITAQGAYRSWQTAREGAAAMQQNAALVERAYTLGETDLQTLLLARRQAISARQGALQARTAALNSHYGLLIDAHLVWELAHEE